jgi:hypothetical protein
MNYSEARNVGSRSLSDLIVEKLLSDESIGKSIGSSVSQKITAKRTRIKEKFDPLNVVKFFSGGSALPTVLLGKMMGRTNEDIQHFAGGKKRTRTKDPLYAHFNSSSVVPLKRDDGVTDIVTKIYVLLKKSHDRKKKEELALLKQEKKIRKQSDDNLKAMIAGLIPKVDGKGADSADGVNPFESILNTVKGIGGGLLAAGGGLLAAGAGAWATRKALMRKPKKPPKGPKPPKGTKIDQPKVEEPEKPKEKTKGEKGTGKATKQTKKPTRGSERFKKSQEQRSQPKPVEPTVEEPKPTAEKVEKTSSKVAKTISKFGKILGAVGLATLAYEVGTLYYKHSKGEISDTEAKKELSKIVATGLGGAGGAALGAMIGSIVPVFGTAVGAIVGGIGGSFAVEKAIDYIERNDIEIPTSFEELRQQSIEYNKKHGGQWGTDESIGQWFERNTTQRARDYVQEQGGQWGVDMSWGDWSLEQITSIKKYIDKSVAEQMTLASPTGTRYNDVMSQNERLTIGSITDQPIFNTNNNISTNVRGSTSYQLNGEKKVRNDQLVSYR